MGLDARGADAALLDDVPLEDARVSQLSPASACVHYGVFYCAKLEYRGGLPLALTETEWGAYRAARERRRTGG